MKTFHIFFEEIEDDRYDRCKLHRLSDIIFMSLYGLLCGAKSWAEIQEICAVREDELSSLLDLQNGIPSLSTFKRVMSIVNSKKIVEILAQMARIQTGSLAGKVIAIDGKTLNGSYDTAKGQSSFHTLNAFVTDNHTVIRQLVGSKKKSEITMIPELLEEIDIKGAIITIDAIACQSEITSKIRAKKADYLIALKGNQKNAFRDVVLLFDTLCCENIPQGINHFSETDKGHGRVENRSYLSVSLQEYPLESLHKFKDIKSVVRVNAVVEKSGKQSQEYRYYISSLEADAQYQGNIIRSHWSIENSLHYVLDVIFCEDSNRSRKDHLAPNFSALRKITMNLMNQDKTKKNTYRSLHTKALAKPEYALELMLRAGLCEKIEVK